jgi:hypothetical protein
MPESTSEFSQNASKEFLVKFICNRKFCATVIALVPIIVLISNSTIDGSIHFRAFPYNTSYELMTCAVGCAVFVAAFLEPKLLQLQTLSSTPVSCLLDISGAPLMVFMLIWSLVQTILNAINQTFGAAGIWAIAVIVSLLCYLYEVYTFSKTDGRSFKQLFFPYITSSSIDKAQTTIALRTILIIFAILLLIPIIMPWEGPPERFVRWHSFSIQGELLWRGTFASFSLCNLLSAIDPSGAGASYVAFMAIQGIFHGTTMLVDNRISASKGSENGNPEHAWSEIPFFLLLGCVLSGLLLTRLRQLKTFDLLPQSDIQDSLDAPSVEESSVKR